MTEQAATTEHILLKITQHMNTLCSKTQNSEHILFQSEHSLLQITTLQLNMRGHKEGGGGGGGEGGGGGGGEGEQAHTVHLEKRRTRSKRTPSTCTRLVIHTTYTARVPRSWDMHCRSRQRALLCTRMCELCTAVVFFGLYVLEYSWRVSYTTSRSCEYGSKALRTATICCVPCIPW
jgi:hypothetical protein